MTKVWDFFDYAVKQHQYQSEHMPEKIESIGESEITFNQKLFYAFERAKVFGLDDDIKKLLIKTEGTNEIEKLPFDIIFLEVEFDVEYLNDKQFNRKITKIVGLLIASVNEAVVTDGKKSFKENTLIDLATLRGVEGFRTWALCLDEDGGYAFNTINVINKNDVFSEKLEVKSYNPKVRKFVLNFVSNFLNLINNPKDVIIQERVFSENKNKQRKRKGLPLIPNRKVIIPTGDFKQYIYDMKKGADFSYSHSFWVRGFWRNYKSDKYKHLKGKKKWIKPFIKGKGVLIDKKYDVKKKEA